MKLDIIENERPLRYSFENCSIKMSFKETFKQNIDNVYIARQQLSAGTSKVSSPLEISNVRYLGTFNAYLRFLHPIMFSQFAHITNTLNVEDTILINLEYYSKRYLKNKQNDTLKYVENLFKLKLLYLKYKAIYLNEISP